MKYYNTYNIKKNTAELTVRRTLSVDLVQESDNTR